MATWVVMVMVTRGNIWQRVLEKHLRPPSIVKHIKRTWKTGDVLGDILKYLGGTGILLYNIFSITWNKSFMPVPKTATSKNPNYQIPSKMNQTPGQYLCVP